MDVVRKIENTATLQNNNPIKEVVITAAEHVKVTEPFSVSLSSAVGPEGDEA